MEYMQLYNDFNHVWSPMAHPDKIVSQEMLVKDECYIWEQGTSVMLLRFASNHSEYAIRANIIIYHGLMQSEDDTPQVLGISGGRFYTLNNLSFESFHK